MEKIGFIGLGRMGLPMAANLVRAIILSGGLIQMTISLNRQARRAAPCAALSARC